MYQCGLEETFSPKSQCFQSISHCTLALGESPWKSKGDLVEVRKVYETLNIH